MTFSPRKMTTKIFPVAVKRLGEEGISIVWSDLGEVVLPSQLLRQSCPSATSKAERGDTSHDKPIQAKGLSRLKVVETTSDEQIRLLKIWGVGNYALGMRWADGHDSGIYTFEYLHELSAGRSSTEKVA